MSGRKMDQSETWARDYLVYRGFKPEDVVFEPDGNVPPDFLVEGRIAVEVRRLNQRWQADGELEQPLEQLSVPLLVRLGKLLDTFGPPTNGVSWYVFHSFKRPQLTRDWEPILRDKLHSFLKGEIQERQRIIRIDDHLTVGLVRRSEPGDRTFLWGGGIDLDEGGWVMSELEKGLAVCIAEKSRKITDYRNRYPEWWLVLADRMMAGTPKTVYVEHDWDKVLVIHPNDYRWAYEVQRSKVV